MNAPAISWGVLILLRLPHSTFHIIPLWPAHHMPQNPQDTISQPVLQQYNKYPDVIIEVLGWLRITDTHNNSITIPTFPSFKQSSLLDYIEGEIVTSKPHLQLEHFKPALLHNKYHHIPSIKKATMYKEQTLDDLPESKPKRHHHYCICLICTITKAKNRNK
eukprot:3184756-Ditylum_brightwellii.AAC.1